MVKRFILCLKAINLEDRLQISDHLSLGSNSTLMTLIISWVHYLLGTSGVLSSVDWSDVMVHFLDYWSRDLRWSVLRLLNAQLRVKCVSLVRSADWNFLGSKLCLLISCAKLPFNYKGLRTIFWVHFLMWFRAKRWIHLIKLRAFDLLQEIVLIWFWFKNVVLLKVMAYIVCFCPFSFLNALNYLLIRYR